MALIDRMRNGPMNINDLFANPGCPKCKTANSMILQIDGYRICRNCGHTTHRFGVKPVIGNLDTAEKESAQK